MTNAGPFVLFTRDLRVHDQPALAAAVDRAEQVVPLFVLDDAVLAAFGAPNRVAFLVDALRDLDASLRERGAKLVLRRGNVVAETVRPRSRCGCRRCARLRRRERVRAGARAAAADGAR